MSVCMAIVKTGLCHSIVDILLDIYEKKKDDEKFLFLCEKEFKHSVPEIYWISWNKGAN